MFNVKVDGETARTVVLKKRTVQVNGETKLIIMVRDISDKVRLEQEQIKKGKEILRTLDSQKNLTQVYTEHKVQVEELYEILNHNQSIKVQNMAFDLRKSNFNLFLDFCEFNDLINIHNDTFRL